MLFGGHDDPLDESKEILNDIWFLDVTNETWTQQFPIQSPSPRHTNLIYNENDGLIYAFGGKSEFHEDSTLVFVYFNDL